MDHKSTLDQPWSITDQHRLSIDHCRSIADYERSNTDYHWSIVDSYQWAVNGYLLCNTMLTKDDLSPDRCRLVVNMY